MGPFLYCLAGMGWVRSRAPADIAGLTVFLVSSSDLSRFSVLKVQKSATHYTETARDEIEILLHIRTVRDTSSTDHW